MSGPVLWLSPVLFALCAGLLTWLLLGALRDTLKAYGSVYEEDAARQLEDVFSFMPARRVIEVAGVLAVLGFALGFFVLGNLRSPQGVLSGTVFGALGAAVAFNVPRLILRAAKIRRLHRFNEQLVEALASISNALKAGFSLMQAFEQVVKEGQNPIAQEFGVFLHQMRVGVRFEDALQQLEQRVGSEDLTLLARAVETARQTGGNLTDVLARIAETIRERLRIQGRIRSLTAQGRLQGWIVGALPLLLLLAMTALDPAMMSDFFGSRAGLVLLAVIVLLEAAGALAIRKIIRIDV